MVEIPTITVECPNCHAPVIVQPVLGEPEFKDGEVTISVTPKFDHDCEAALFVPEASDE